MIGSSYYKFAEPSRQFAKNNCVDTVFKAKQDKEAPQISLKKY